MTKSALTEVIDPPHLYKIYGDTSSQIMLQVERCAPRQNKGYTGAAKHSLNFEYRSAVQPDGTCKVAVVAVRIHAGMILPDWAPSRSAAPGLASSWRKYRARVRAFLQGYIDNDLRWARKLYADVRSLLAADCDALAAKVDATVDRDLDALARANDAHRAEASRLLGGPVGKTPVTTFVVSFPPAG